MDENLICFFYFSISLFHSLGTYALILHQIYMQILELNRNFHRVFLISESYQIFGFLYSFLWWIIIEGTLERVDVWHELLVHLDFLDGDLPRISQIVPHLVLLVVHYRLLETCDHLTLPLDELGLFLNSLQVSVKDMFLSPEPLLFHGLLLHSVLHVEHVRLRLLLGSHWILRFHHLLRGVTVGGDTSWVGWSLLGIHEWGWWVHLLRDLVHLLNVLLRMTTSGRTLTKMIVINFDAWDWLLGNWLLSLGRHFWHGWAYFVTLRIHLLVRRRLLLIELVLVVWYALLLLLADWGWEVIVVLWRTLACSWIAMSVRNIG